MPRASNSGSEPFLFLPSHNREGVDEQRITSGSWRLDIQRSNRSLTVAARKSSSERLAGPSCNGSRGPLAFLHLLLPLLQKSLSRSIREANDAARPLSELSATHAHGLIAMRQLRGIAPALHGVRGDGPVPAVPGQPDHRSHHQYHTARVFALCGLGHVQDLPGRQTLVAGLTVRVTCRASGPGPALRPYACRGRARPVRSRRRTRSPRCTGRVKCKWTGR